MIEVLTWCLTVLLMLTGFVGVIVPLLPGTTLILLGAVLHKLVLPEDLSWWIVAAIAALWLASIVADFAGAAIGTKWFGGSRWGMAGATGGALIGVFISLPALLLGTVLGAIAAEKLAGKKSDKVALKSGVGAATGFVISTAARLACAVAMIVVFVATAVS